MRHATHTGQEEEYRKWITALRFTTDAWKLAASSLNERREKERLAVQALDKVALDSGESWFIIHAEWLDSWSAFTQPGSSAPVPGPINNRRLLESNGEPLQGLVRGRDYRGVTKGVWEILFHAYGGGPTIQRPTLSIYQTAGANIQRRR